MTARPPEARLPYTIMGGPWPEMGRTRMDVQCPYCARVLTVYLWSFAGSGKRCPCGARLSLHGGARKPA